MGREVSRLTARKVQTLSEPGRHADGGGLYLVVDVGGAKRWCVLYRLDGRRREMGLGSALAVPLTRARELAERVRQDVAAGIDPIAARRTPPPGEAHPTITFGAVAERYLDDRESTWRNAQHRWQWRQTLEVQAAPIWAKPVDAVTTDDVLAVLRPMWTVKAETARRLRGRIERILDAARAGGHRSGENPARWRGHLDVILPRPRRLARGHHAAMPYRDVPRFLVELRARRAISARALEFQILTAARPGEVRGVTWGEVDLAAALWTVPGDRMKGGRPHRVPLSAPALALLRARLSDRPEPEGVIFTNDRGAAFSDMVFGLLLERMKADAFTAHGFRSSFRDWVEDETDHARELAEAALAHLVGDETERAYRRGDALLKRRVLMDDWAAFCAGASSPSAAAQAPAAEG